MCQILNYDEPNCSVKWKHKLFSLFGIQTDRDSKPVVVGGHSLWRLHGSLQGSQFCQADRAVDHPNAQAPFEEQSPATGHHKLNTGDADRKTFIKKKKKKKSSTVCKFPKWSVGLEGSVSFGGCNISTQDEFHFL